jgi:hypothetical protein
MTEIGDAMKDYDKNAEEIDELTYLRRRVAVLEAQIEWQPIETAPKDGSQIDVFVLHRGRVCNVRWSLNGCWSEYALDDFDGTSWQKLDGLPTHWMPLPKPPKEIP